MISSKMIVMSLVLMTCSLAAQVTLAAKPQPLVTGVIDATGKAVGKLVGTFRYGHSPYEVPFVYADVSLEVNGTKFVVSVDKNQFYGNSELWFTGPDCTGQVYFEGHIINSAPRMYPAIGVPPVGGIVYIANPNGNVTAVSISSHSVFISSNGGQLSTTCYPSSTTLTDAIEAINLGDLTTLYTPPFTFQIAP